MSHSASVHHETEEGEGVVWLEFIGVTVYGGKSARMNPPGKAHPAEAPDVDFSEVRIEEDELGRDLDPMEVFEQHDTHFVDELIEMEGERMAEGADGPEYDPDRDGRW